MADIHEVASSCVCKKLPGDREEVGHKSKNSHLTKSVHVITTVAMIFIVFFIILISKIRFSLILKSVKPVLFIIIFTMILNLFFTVGDDVFFRYKWFVLTYGAIETSVKMALRIFLLVISASMLTFTTTPIVLTDGLEKLMAPLKVIKVPVHEIAMMMSIALRFIPTLIDETDKIIKAQSSRGADFDTGNVISRIKSFIPILIPLFVSAFRRAEELATAMESRCYKGGEGRTKMKVLTLKKVDAIISCAAILCFTIIILSDKLITW